MEFPFSLSSGGDMALDTGLTKDQQNSLGASTGGGSNSNVGGFKGDSINNVAFQFKNGDSGSAAMDFAAGFFKNTQPAKNESLTKTGMIAVSVVIGLSVVAFILKGRK